MEKINCPICDSLNIKLSFQKDSHDLYKCGDCSLVFVWPIPVGLEKIYTETYFKNKNTDNKFGYTDYDQDKESMRSTFFTYLDIIKSFSKGNKIFDVGAATGYFLDLAKQREWQTYGIEISDYAAEQANKRGHRVFCANNIKDVDCQEKFDVVTMWDVLEHIKDPLDYLKQINNILDDNSLLVINTIDKGSLWARIFGKRWNAIVLPEHLYYYSLKNLKELLSRTGFEIIETKKIGKKFSLPYIFSILYHWQNIKLYQKLSNFFTKGVWKKISIPINLRDNIFIVAKKIKDV